MLSLDYERLLNKYEEENYEVKNKRNEFGRETS